MTPFVRRGRNLFAYATLLILLAVLHGHNLSSRGILEHDEGHNLLAARTYSDVIRWIATGGPLHSSPQQLDALKNTLHRQGGTLYPAGKPGYVIGLAVASLIPGVSQSTGLWLAWAAGLLAVALSGYVARVLYGPKSYAPAVTMLGVGLSPLIGYLSREVGGTIWSIAFGLAGFALLLPPLSIRQRRFPRLRAFAAGVFFGYGFACHYNLLPAIAAAFLADLLHNSSDASRTLPGIAALQLALRHRLQAYLFALTGIAVVLGGFEIVSLAAEHKLHTIYPKYQNYFAELVRIVGTYQLPALEGGAVNEGARGWGNGAFLYMLTHLLREGVLLLLVAGVILTALVRRETLRPILPALGFFCVIAGFWVLHPWKLERSWGMLVIAGWLVAARFADMLRLSANLEFRKLVTVSALGINIAIVFRPWLELWAARSPIPEAVDETRAYVRQNGGMLDADCAGSSFAPLWKWTIIERARNPQMASALQYVDFSSFHSSTVVFTDPNSWRDPDFSKLRPRITNAHLITETTSRIPAWHLSAYDLRTSGTARIPR
jgi:hypothetical protein